MQVNEIAPDIYVFVGSELQSVATAVVAGEAVLLVDTLASTDDARALQGIICGEMRKQVRTIVVTHYMDDHLAGLALFHGASICAHAHYSHTYFSQGSRAPRADAEFVHPTMLVHDRLDLSWGRHELRIFHNPGHTVSTLNVDIPTADLILTADNHVGHIAYLSTSAPAMLDGALETIAQLRRRIHIPGHMGPQGGAAPRDARTYLRRLQEHVARARNPDGQLDPDRLSGIDAEQCSAEGRALTPFEREWHAQNLRVIAARNLFPAGPAGDVALPHAC